MGASVIEVPARMASLPRDKLGRVVPWFVAWIDGEPDFRVIGPGKIEEAHRFSLCWVCGQRRGRTVTFLIGPMCAVNRTSSEPPSHIDCADYSARVCPFLTKPQMVRRDRHMPANTVVAGEMIRRNPGVALVWTTRNYQPFSDGAGGVLFEIGAPTEVRWYAEGRPATRAEVLRSIDTGLPLLHEMAADEGPGALRELDRRHLKALELAPV